MLVGREIRRATKTFDEAKTSDGFSIYADHTDDGTTHSAPFPNCLSAISIALSMPRALVADSSYSAAGMLS